MHGSLAAEALPWSAPGELVASRSAVVPARVRCEGVGMSVFLKGSVIEIGEVFRCVAC